ncbi:MAG: SLC13 family permease [Acidobacteriota bacterium]
MTLFAVIALSSESIATEVVACTIIGALVISGTLGVDAALAGFGNPALMMIVGLMIITGGLIHNGAADRISRAIGRIAAGRESRVIPLLLGSVAFVSAWINNTAATAMFIPVAEGISKRTKTSVSRYLMPLAFSSMLGGCVTLIGTSTNIAVSGALKHFGLEPISMFEMTPVGLLVAAVGLAYLVLLKTPARAPALNRAEVYGIQKYLFEIRILPGSSYVGLGLERCDFLRAHELTVLGIDRGATRVLSPGRHDVVQPEDLLLVEGDLRSLVTLKGSPGIEVAGKRELSAKDLTSEKVKLVEATITYNSPLIGWSLKGVGFRQRYGLNVVALRRRGEVLVEKIAAARLKAGDVLLLQGSDDAFRRLAAEPSSLLLEDIALPAYDFRKEIVASIIFVVSILLTATELVPGAISVLLGAASMILFRTLTVKSAYEYVNLRLVVLVASMFALGEAMEKSGAAAQMAGFAVAHVGSSSPTMILFVLCVITIVLTQPMNNAAAALLVLPVAVHAAELAHCHPRPLVLGITFAASCSFITPFEPSCILIWDTGKYRFFDFLRMGLPLTVVLLGIITLTVPWFWAF